MVKEKKRSVEEVVSVVPNATEDLEKLQQLEARVNQMKIASKQLEMNYEMSSYKKGDLTSNKTS